MKRTAPALFALAALVSMFGAACSSSSPADDSVGASEGSSVAAEEVTVSEPDTPTAGSLKIPPGAVPIQFFMAKGPNPLLKEIPVELTETTDTVTMNVTDITYAGVVCGFSFTGTERPTPPVQFSVEIENADGTVVSAVVPVDWEGDVEKGSGNVTANGWSFLSGTGPNRNGPGWMVQVGGIPAGGGKSAPAPKQAVCSVKSAKPFSPAAGPVSYWAGFATQ